MTPKETLVKKRSDFFDSSEKQAVIQQNQFNKNNSRINTTFAAYLTSIKLRRNQ